MISLGRGFYEFGFSSAEDMRRIFATGSWTLKPGLLRISFWSPDFNTTLQKSTHAQCWIKITGLPQEYWCPTIIFSIAGGIGSPISLDVATSNRSFGHFARILVDVNLMNLVPNQILVERYGFEFFVGIKVENAPAFCTGCHVIGHMISKCRRNHKKEVIEEVVKPVVKSAETVPSQDGINLVIDLDIEKSEEVVSLGLERLILHQEGNVEKVAENIEPEEN
ncbi:hypothetical protein Lal_00040005 [Lupinus albus]|nr:hypothetical protein Lal_00040005 [Lupinus albus]